jgi:hypothetical protein
MKKLIGMFVILVMVGALCVGCQKTETSATEKPKTEDNNAGANWQPEKAKQPTTKPHDHDHGAPGHRH